MFKIILTFLIIVLTGSSLSRVQAQAEVLNIFKSGVADLNTVANGYLKPAGNSFSSGLGSNWYNTAEVHKVWGFDLTIGAGVVIVPESDRTFSLSGLTNLKLTDPTATQAPTFAGKGNGVELNLMQPHYLSNGSVNPFWNNGNGKITTFSTPQGIIQYVPTASLQFTLGIPYVNDVSIRLIPTIKSQGLEVSFWGVGIKHNFKQWIPVVKDLPFDAAVVLAYSQFDLNYTFSGSSVITPEKLVSGGVTYAPDPNSNDYTNQGMKVKASAETVNLVFSKKLLFITPYIGFGLTNTSFEWTMTGNYPTLGDPLMTHVGGTEVPVFNSNGKPIMQINNFTDPIHITSSEVMANATLGLRVNMLGVLTVHAQYAFQRYPLASMGIGLTFR